MFMLRLDRIMSQIFRSLICMCVRVLVRSHLMAANFRHERYLRAICIRACSNQIEELDSTQKSLLRKNRKQLDSATD